MESVHLNLGGHQHQKVISFGIGHGKCTVNFSFLCFMISFAKFFYFSGNDLGVHHPGYHSSPYHRLVLLHALR